MSLFEPTGSYFICGKHNCIRPWRSMSTLIVISLPASCLPYASLCIRSLTENLDGDEAIHLLTDTPTDREQLQQAFAGLKRIKVQLSDELWEDRANPMRKCAGLEKL